MNETQKPSSEIDTTKKSSGGEEPDKSSGGEEPDKSSNGEEPHSWDAVCVFGLRVFAKEAEAQIEVRKSEQEK